MADAIVPDSFQNRHDWLKNLHDEIDTHALALGLDSGEVSTVKTILAPLVAKYADVLDKARDLDTSVGTAGDAFDDQIAELRRTFGEWRKKAGYNDGIGRALGITSTGGKPDPATIKPTLKAQAHRGFVRLSGRKNYAETVNLYMRRRGETTWRLVVAKRKTFPFDDQTPLATAGLPEERDYYSGNETGGNQAA